MKSEEETTPTFSELLALSETKATINNNYGRFTEKPKAKAFHRKFGLSIDLLVIREMSALFSRCSIPHELAIFRIAGILP